MIVIAILGILMGIGGTSWTSYREATRVDSAKEKVVSILQQARLKALSSGFQQDVLLDWTNDTITYSANGNPVVFTMEQGIDIAGYKCTAPVAASLTDVSTFKFKRSGTFSVSTLPSGKRPRTVRITSPSSAKVFYVKVNNVTGRVSVWRLAHDEAS